MRRCAGRTYMRVGLAVAVMRVDVDRRQSRIGDVEGRECVLVLTLDGVVKLHHRRQRDWHRRQVVGIRPRPVAAARDGSVRLGVWRVHHVLRSWVCVVGKEGRRARSVPLEAVGEDALVLILHRRGELAGH